MIPRDGLLRSTVVIVGPGQLGRIFAGGFLRAGYAVVPVNRGDDMGAVAAALPDGWKSLLGLVQNELLPRDREQHRIERPTVAPVWFEKKKGMAAKPLLPTPAPGPRPGLCG